MSDGFLSLTRSSAALVGKTEISHCQAAILHHHERYDGAGYPDGLQGQRIPLDARIIGLTSAFVAMMTERSYAPKLTQAQAIEELRTNAGTQFDPEMVEHFIMLQQKTAAAAGAAE
jgi:response regulator RpfG family c-di-GMP phosphodiesterase